MNSLGEDTGVGDSLNMEDNRTFRKKERKKGKESKHERGLEYVYSQGNEKEGQETN